MRSPHEGLEGTLKIRLGIAEEPMPNVYRFDTYTLEVAEHRLRRGDQEVSLPPKAFETLVYLVQRHGHLVKKNELLDAVWAGIAVTEGVLTLRIKEIRQALGDDAKNPRFIKTIPTVGYKFTAEVLAEIEQAQRETPTSLVPLERPKKSLLTLLAAI